MSRRVVYVLLAVLAFAIVDAFVSFVNLGFYSPGFHFDFDRAINRSRLFVPYDFTTSAVDFILLSNLRKIILCVGSLQFLFKRVRKASLFLMGTVLLNCSFTLTKLLAFAENPEQLAFGGLWLSLVWNVLAGIGIFVFWQGVFLDESFHEAVDSLWSQADDHQLLVNEATDESPAADTAPANEPRISTFWHVMRLLAYCKHHGRWFLAGFFFLTIYSSARIFQPYFTAQVISIIINRGGMAALVHSVLIMSILSLVSAFTGGLRGGCFDYATALINRKMRGDLFNSIMVQEVAFFDESKTGEIVSRLTSDCQTMSSIVSTNVNVLLRNGVMLIGSLVFLFYISWRLTLVTFIAVPVIAFTSKVYGTYYDHLSESTQAAIAKANQIAEQAIGSVRTVRSFACEGHECNRFANQLDNTLAINRKKSVAYMGYTWMNEIFDSGILVAILFYGGHLVMTKQMTSDQLVNFLLYQLQMGENLYSISNVFTGLMEGVGASRKVFEYMERQPKIQYVGDINLEKVDGRIQFNGVTFSYPTRPNATVLNDVTFEAKPGETIALVGPSGAGKSSIISLLEHFYEPQNGKILLDGMAIDRLEHGFFHRVVSLVAQEPVLYDGTVRYNILYGCEHELGDSEMMEAAKMANIHDFIMSTEQRYDTECGEKGVQMSGGQKQRIAIARALVRQPSVLILDEATSALDAESEFVIQEALTKCAVGRTVIVIAHRLSTVEKADKIIVINQGQVQQQGSHTELMQDRAGIYYGLVQRQLLNSQSAIDDVSNAISHEPGSPNTSTA